MRAGLVRAVRQPLGVMRRWVRARRPGGAVATDRRLLAGQRAALGTHILVAGDPTAVRLALPDARLDVLGTRPYDRGVTVLSDGLGAGALPVGRWTGVVLLDPAPDVAADMVAAARSGCRTGGSVVVIGPGTVTGRPRRRRRLERHPVR